MADPSASEIRQRATAARPHAGDLLLAAVLAVVGGTMAFAAATAQGFATPLLPAVVAATEAAPLAWRRRTPLLVLAAVTGVFVVGAVVTGVAATPLLGPVVATYTVATRHRRGVAAAAAAVVAIGMPVVVVAGSNAPFPLTFSVTATPGHLLDAVLGSSLGIGGATLLGAYVGTRRAYVAELAERARRLEREREQRAERAVVEERSRIARELHDVAAHHLSGIALQASALERTLDRNPDEARGMVEDIRAESSTALTAMRRLVDVLRGDDGDGRQPQPTIDDVEQLVARARDDGADIRLDVGQEADDAPLPREVGLAAYRIVQESLTNVRRHASGARATVRIHRTDTALHLEVVDDGPPTSSPTASEVGHGLIGMRERATLLGGTLQAGPREGRGGWRVRACLPITRGRTP